MQIGNSSQVDIENVAEVRKVSVELLLAKNVAHVHICMSTKTSSRCNFQGHGVRIRRRPYQAVVSSITMQIVKKKKYSRERSHILCLPVFLYMISIAMEDLLNEYDDAALHEVGNKKHVPSPTSWCSGTGLVVTPP